ncbi:hypothetical protein DVW08_05815 [Clostridium botulinum]|nr:hypothetical protein [Clostridium botulinum]
MKKYIVTNWEGDIILDKEATEDDIIKKADSMGYDDYYLFLKDINICKKVLSIAHNKDIKEILYDLGDIKENKDYILVYSGEEDYEYISAERVREYSIYKYCIYKCNKDIEFIDTESLYINLLTSGNDIYIERNNFSSDIHYVLCNLEVIA